MLTLSRRTVIAGTALATLGLASTVAIAGQGGTSNAQPANKAVAAGSTVQEFHPSATGTPILSAHLKTSKPTDLLIGVSLECSILTDLNITGGPDVHEAIAR